MTTLGTPNRGALDALSHVVDGFKMLFIDFSPALETMMSSYQLMPRYRAVLDERRGHAPGWK